MLRTFKIFFGTEGTRPLLILFCLLAASTAEAVSLSTLVPAAATIAGGTTGDDSRIGAYVRAAFGLAGLAPSIANLVLCVAGFMIIKSILSFAALSYAGIAAARVAMNFRQRLVKAVFDARWSFFAEQKSGRFANVISNDAGRAGDAYLLSAQVVALTVQATAYTLVAFFIDWRLAFLGVTASALMAAIMRYLIRSAKRAGYKQTDRTSALAVHLVDMLGNIKPLKSMQRYDSMLAKVATILKRLKRALIARELSKSALAQGGDAMLAVFAGAGVYAASALWNVSLPEIVVSGIILVQIISIISKLQKMLQNSVLMESAYVRTEELIAEAEANREVGFGRTVPAGDLSCRFDNVSFSHGSHAVISNASFQIPANAITVLSGRSGSGKTTIIDLLIGLNRPSKGQISIGGTPAGEIDLRAWRKSIGYVAQELSLFHTSIRENISLGDDQIGDEAILLALEQAGAQEFVSRLPNGLDTDVGEMGGKLSGGQRQRISLARALVTRPQVLILDEVTSALDPATETEIVGNIAALRGKYTIVVITHRPAWTAIADRLYKVSHGKVTPAGRDQTRKARK